MLEQLKFVQGSIAKKGFIPELKHFRIENGTVRGYNGSLALCAELGIELTCTPLAEPLIKAIQNCDDESTTKLTLTPTGKLRIKSGKFSALINCIPEEQYVDPHVKPDGEFFEFNGELFLEGIKKLSLFVSDDASRPWSNGILFSEQSMYATNNVILAQYWIGSVFPYKINLPRDAIKEILRIGKPPVKGQVSDNSITLHYEDGRWLRAQLLTHEWPDVNAILNKGTPEYKEVPEDLFEAVGKIKPFTDNLGRVFFKDGLITSTEIPEEQSAEIVVNGVEDGAIFNVDMLEKVLSIATFFDTSTYPAPCAFVSGKLRGVIIGLKR